MNMSDVKLTWVEGPAEVVGGPKESGKRIEKTVDKTEVWQTEGRNKVWQDRIEKKE